VRFISLLVITALALATSVAATKQRPITRLDGSQISPNEVDDAVTRLMRSAEVTGVGIAIFAGGEISYLKAYGVRDKEKNLPLTADSVMTAASLSKVAFAYMVMQLVDEKLIDLDKPVYQYLPKPLSEYSNYQDLANDPRWLKITARMLLSHTSGFPNWRWVNEDRKLNINFEPGTRFAYSGEGIDLLQLVVETITKKPLGELMRERIFEPFGMTRTSMIWQSAFESDYATGYDEYGRSLGPERRKTADAAGSMQTTPHDFAHFFQAVMRGERLKKQTRKMMVSPQIEILSKHEFPSLVYEPSDENKAIRLSYGLAWGLYWTRYGEAFFKEGHDEGWRNYVVCFDKPKIGLMIMTNSSNGEGIFKELIETLLKNPYTPIEWEGYTPWDKLPPRAKLKEHKEVTLDPTILDRYVGRYSIPPNVILKVTRGQNSRLIVQENDETPQELAPEDERTFFSTSAHDEYIFEVDASGRTTQMILRTDGKDLPIKRFE
jgi:CubicO group peptidase (beta-lactamase class C family)